MSISNNKVALMMLLLGTACLSQAQISPQDHTALRNLARKQLDDVLKRNGGEFADPVSDLEELVQASQALEILGEGPRSDEICRVITKTKNRLYDKMTVPHVYHLAETWRFYRCGDMKTIPDQIESTLKNDVQKLTKPSSLHYAFLMNQRASEYHREFKTKPDLLNGRVKDVLLPSFNQSDFGIDGGYRTEGISIDSLKALEIFSSVPVSEANKVASNYITKINKQTIQQGDKYSYFSQSLVHGDLTAVALNYYTALILKHSNQIDSLTKDQRVGLRNYFVQQAALSPNVKELLYALKGLLIVGQDIPAAKITSDRTVPVTGGKSVKYELVNSFGKPIKGVKSIKASLADLSDTHGLKDVTKQVKFTDDNTVATWTPEELQAGRYQLVFTADGYTLSTQVVTVTDAITFGSLQYAITTSRSFPTKFDGKIENPDKLPSDLKQATDNQFLHLTIDAKFQKTARLNPAQVYVSFKKSGDGNIPVNSYGKYNRDTKLYEVTFDISKDLEVHLNGDYLVTVHAADSRADKPTQWKLGKARIWYKEGLEEGTNNGIKPEYEPLPTINFVYPPEQPQISLLLPGIGALGLFFVFMKFFGSLFTNRANLSNLNFSGILFLGNLLLILTIFAAFYIEVKLIPTLWLLLFLSPFSFFIAHRALSSADCSIGEFVKEAAPLQVPADRLQESQQIKKGKKIE